MGRHDGAPPETARCVAGKIIDAYSLDELNDPNGTEFQSQTFFEQVQGFAVGCAGG